MIKNTLLSLALIFSQVVLMSQPTEINHKTSFYRNSGTMVYDAYLKNNAPDYSQQRKKIQQEINNWIEQNQDQLNTNKTIYRLPVVVHIVYNETTQNIPDSQVLEQLEVLNQDFRNLNSDSTNVPAEWQALRADIGVEFCLAQQDPAGNPTSGIERRQTTITAFGYNDDRLKYFDQGGLDVWDRNRYINIWITNLDGGNMSYTQFPGGAAETDGLVIDYQYFGTTNTLPPYNLGRVTTHEMGYFFDLLALWGDETGNCTASDFCDDTPTQFGPTIGCPNFPKTDACSPGSPGIMFMNFMDYTDDACMGFFTLDQKARILATLNGFRAPLKSSNGCEPPQTHLYDTLLYPLEGTWICNYMNGNNEYNDLAKANYFEASYTNNKPYVHGMIVEFCFATLSTTNGSAIFAIWEDNGTGNNPAENPLVEKAVSIDEIINNINDDMFTYAAFDSAVAVNGAFYAGVILPDAASGDTVILISNSDGDTNPGIAWEQWEDQSWHPYSETGGWEVNIALGIHPVLSDFSSTKTNITTKGNIFIYPNPATNFIHFSFQETLSGNAKRISIFDQTGKEVLSKTTHSKIYQIDLSDFNAGLYFYIVNHGQMQFSGKFLKAR